MLTPYRASVAGRPSTRTRPNVRPRLLSSTTSCLGKPLFPSRHDDGSLVTYRSPARASNLVRARCSATSRHRWQRGCARSQRAAWPRCDESYQAGRRPGSPARTFRGKFCVLLQAALRRRPVRLRTQKTKDQWRNNQSVMVFSSRDSGLRRS